MKFLGWNIRMVFCIVELGGVKLKVLVINFGGIFIKIFVF